MNTLPTRPFCELLHRQGGKVQLENLYRVYLGKRQGQDIWIVDGAKVVRHLYPPFVMGGNDQRYRFNPVNDIWIDNRIGVIELEYTIGHELIERKHMRSQGMSYDKAHNHGLELERRMRAADANAVEKQRALVDERIAPVYRAFYRSQDGLSVWLVDGPTVRATLDGDFCFGATDIDYSFIPEDEVWMDATMSCEHTHFALVHIMERRRLYRSGMRSCSYEGALAKQIEEYAAQEKLAREHEARLEPVPYGDRFRGVKPRKRRRGKRG
jgi:hypothetical protein